ncbi:MAG: VacJ family lipoprotein, partial [Marinovum sp.]|nr:VacJ family lipoprotein [Marinovum sp.]
TSTRVGSILSRRGQFAGTVDSVLYESADSYAQMRSIFLQRRRFELGGQQEDAYFDPYDDIFDDE